MLIIWNILCFEEHISLLGLPESLRVNYIWEKSCLSCYGDLPNCDVLLQLGLASWQVVITREAGVFPGLFALFEFVPNGHQTPPLRVNPSSLSYLTELWIMSMEKTHTWNKKQRKRIKSSNQMALLLMWGGKVIYYLIVMVYFNKTRLQLLKNKFYLN